MHFDGQDRRSNRGDRRARSLAAYWHGSWNPRRRSGRRTTDRVYPVIDWHSNRVFALVLSILILCVADGLMTIVLMTLGATEANPVMALFVPHDLGWFAAVKLSLTTMGLVVLTIVSRMRVFRILPGESRLYVTLAGYVALIAYELQMLEILLALPA